MFLVKAIFLLAVQDYRTIAQLLVKTVSTKLGLFSSSPRLGGGEECKFHSSSYSAEISIQPIKGQRFDTLKYYIVFSDGGQHRLCWCHILTERREGKIWEK
ncbi:hypothetical protein PoB_005877000 [Plakobranchus ocellatus]|uniref:Uncharacterized protein n=1 Tax=Plakobranchus ocellatus TaxID=259542 RepID=A0AAV4CKT6_9GAST|nr:hypothetical protein PoB_005877000 [Plakobranchus ocellatus]